MNGPQVLVVFGPLIVLGIVILIIPIGVLLYLWKGYNLLTSLAEFDIENFFGCEECILDASHGESNDDSRMLLNSQIHKRKVYINKNCNNIDIEIDQMKISYFIHMICVINFAGYLFIQILFHEEVTSTMCLNGYKCVNENQTDVCSNFNSSDNDGFNGAHLLCEKFGIESFDTFIIRVAIIIGVMKTILLVSKYIFKFAVKISSSPDDNVEDGDECSLMTCGIYILLLLLWIVAPVSIGTIGEDIIKSGTIVKAIAYAAIFIATLIVGCQTGKQLVKSKSIHHRHYILYYRTTPND